MSTPSGTLHVVDCELLLVGLMTSASAAAIPEIIPRQPIAHREGNAALKLP